MIYEGYKFVSPHSTISKSIFYLSIGYNKFYIKSTVNPTLIGFKLSPSSFILSRNIC